MDAFMYVIQPLQTRILTLCTIAGCNNVSAPLKTCITTAGHPLRSTFKGNVSDVAMFSSTLCQGPCPTALFLAHGLLHYFTSLTSRVQHSSAGRALLASPACSASLCPPHPSQYPCHVPLSCYVLIYEVNLPVLLLPPQVLNMFGQNNLYRGGPVEGMQLLHCKRSLGGELVVGPGEGQPPVYLGAGPSTMTLDALK